MTFSVTAKSKGKTGKAKDAITKESVTAPPVTVLSEKKLFLGQKVSTQWNG